jgi:cytochrome c oxidase cbb3-type subunit I
MSAVASPSQQLITRQRSSAAADAATARVAYQYLVWATVWLLVGTVAGLLPAIKLNWPDFLPTPWLSFGRIRPIHTNTVFWGWSTMALVGLAIYVASRTSRAPLWSPALARIALWLWNATVFGGVVTLSAGWSRGPQEYREWVWPLAALLGLGVVLNGYNIYRTVGTRQLPEVYISNWYILGAFCWLLILYVTAYLPIYESGVGNVVIQGYYMHTAVGMWFTILAIGITYYALPRLLGRPIYSYALGVLGFWTNMLFYTVIGAHHFIFSPIPTWLQTIAILFSVGMMVPVWAGTGNFLLTLRGARHAVHQSYALPFLLVGILGYGLGSTQGTFEAFRTANIYLHFTNFTVGHSHATMYAFIAFIIWGAAYGLVPQFTGREPNPIIVGVHFWLALVGVVIYVVALSVAGVLQGMTWVAGRSFIASIVAAEPLWLWRTVGGLLMAGSHVAFAVNVWAMRPDVRLSEQISAIPIASTRHA